LEEKASAVLLSALSIPIFNASDESNKIDFSIEKEKNMAIAKLLGFTSDTSRSALLAELGKAGLFEIYILYECAV
jgi:hypothetical protein